MKTKLFLLLAIVLCYGCKKDTKNEGSSLEELPMKVNKTSFSEVEIAVLLSDSTLNIRALELLKNEAGCYFLTSKGVAGQVKTPDLNNVFLDEITYPITIDADKTDLNFRALAVTNTAKFGISVGSPAYLYKINDSGASLVYQEDHEKAFYDAMAFWNDKEGIAIGDPTDSCMSIIITRDGGETWTKIDCENLPPSKEGEAAFAASDTNIKISGDKTWVATGGKASRVLFSGDKGLTWEVFDTPIVQGVETAGMYSIDFYDDKTGYAIGGDYTKPDAMNTNKIKTQDGGKTWQVAAKNKIPGYRSCVQYVPNSDGKSLVTVGFKGIDYSNDGGEHWTHLTDEGFYTIRFVNDSVAYAAGNKRLAKLNFR
ncbi:oxidoreductase [Bizionia paragorgiae]|uniref:oxidoreductase n=1 Tax=Bizionia paragorgiae TaxID=283786 RepID=UPI00299DA251|nr:oxidoreductase [Bizionia paragorgiae]MDX1270692.1 oxidoreductase [Bizionia paragorgiae]